MRPQRKNSLLSDQENLTKWAGGFNTTIISVILHTLLFFRQLCVACEKTHVLKTFFATPIVLKRIWV